MVIAGAVTGCGVGLASVRDIEPLLYELEPSEATGFLMPALAMLGAAVLAAIPA